jgi:hypothetical protein
MTVTELLPWLNLLLIPALSSLIKTERRMTRLETIVELLQKELANLRREQGEPNAETGPVPLRRIQ